MNEQQADQIVMLMKAAAARPVDQDSIDYFASRLTQFEYEPSLAAATVGAGVWRYFPSWADFMELYRAQRALSDPTGEARSADKTPIRSDAGPISREIPFWVKRYIAARFLYARFDKEQDLRPFPDHKDRIDYTRGPVDEWMPDDAWVDEAARVSDQEVWGHLNPKSGDWTF